MKLKPVHHGQTDALIGYAHWCEGCKEAHIFFVPRWTFNGNMEKPTFGPSMRLFEHAIKDAAGNVTRPERTLCHYFLVDGVVEYLADSTDHNLRGKRPLVDIPAYWGV